MLKILRGILALLPVLLGTVGYAEDMIAVSAEVDKGTVTIGEKIHYTVSVKHSPDIKILSAIDFPNPGQFEVKAVWDLPGKVEDGTKTSGRSFEIAAYGLGEFVIDEQSIRYENGDGKQGEVRANRLYITVTSVIKAGTTPSDIRGIKGPVDLLTSPAGLLIAIVLLGLIGLGSWIGWRYQHRRTHADVPRVEPLSPHDEAYQALQRLRDSSLLREGRVKEYYFQLSDIMRRYMERRFGFPAVECTTEEIVRSLSNAGTEQDLPKRPIYEFLQDVDMVKFAKHLPSAQEVVQVMRQAIEIVDKTRIEKTSESLSSTLSA